MIYLQLFLAFLKVGCFSFGGAYGAIPLIREVVLNNSWLTDEELADMIAISESTPGPIMVNMATYIGSNRAGIIGALIATLAVVLPAFVIILLVMVALQSAMENKYVKAILRGITPSIIGIILSMGIYMIAHSLNVDKYATMIDYNALLLLFLLLGLMFSYKRVMKKNISSILFIIVSAILGIFIY